VASQAVLDRNYGKLPQRIQVSGELGLRGRVVIND
jgi:hypothetical protein